MDRASSLKRPFDKFVALMTTIFINFKRVNADQVANMLYIFIDARGSQRARQFTDAIEFFNANYSQTIFRNTDMNMERN